MPSIDLCFVRDVAPPKRKGPFRSVRFEGETIRAERDGPALAKHEDHEWRVDGDRYGRLECEGRAIVHFERTDGTHSKVHGPYGCVTFIDGVAYVDHHIFAFVDRSIGDWYCHDEGRHWPLMVISAAQ